ncbi:unnamed protein product [Cylindrotheca closterium]|uniref:Bacterial Pleckstrin homology domain-containing protein n=1 Tax=Cylindrotheca closterium TaxID=2856 RepID=A0AAD2G660_9STRA|nr:unnamed protein product [Cylindrotheca closterium]
MGVVYDFIFDNAYQQDAGEEERKVREKYPLLLHKDERVELAFRDRGGIGRDKEYFTSHRILIKDGKGVGSKRKNYQSIPYASIQAFKVETAGKFDGDVQVTVWSTGVPKASIDFATANVDIYQLQQFLNSKVMDFVVKAENPELQDKIDSTPPKMDQKESKAGKFWDLISDNAKQIDAMEAEEIFKTTMPVLLANERIELIFKSGRDYTALTNYRVLLVDVQGIYGMKIEFISILWSSIKAFSVQTAGAFMDRDVEMRLYTNILRMEYIEQDFRKTQCNLFAIQKAMCNHVLLGELGNVPAPFADLDLKESHVDQKGFWWFRDNQRPLDAVEMNRQYHQDPPLLMEREQVEMAFKGHRDITMFTNLRVIVIDPKGLVGKQVEYTSLPWRSIVAHSATSSGKYLDWDSEIGFYTEMAFYPGEAGGDDRPPVPPRPWKSFFELDFNKNLVDINALNYYMSRRLLLINKMEVGTPIPMSTGSNYSRPTSMFGKMLEYVGSDQSEIDASVVDQALHAGTPILLEDERVLLAFKAGRDMSLFTNLRIMTVDVQGLTGHKVEYTSIPYKSIRAWSVETAGHWDTDTKLNLYTKNRWHIAKVDMDFRTGRCDIAQINRFLSALIIGQPGDRKVDLGFKNYNSGSREANPIKASSFGILGNSWEIDKVEVENKLRTDPCLLLDEEKVLKAFQSGRDIDVYTNRRMIVVDTKGLTGKSVKYKSLPWKYVEGFEFETAGPLIDRDAEMYLYYQLSDVQFIGPPRSVTYLRTKQSLLVKNINIYEIGAIFVGLVLFNPDNEKYEDDPEFPMFEGQSNNAYGNTGNTYDNSRNAYSNNAAYETSGSAGYNAGTARSNAPAPSANSAPTTGYRPPS